MAKWNRNRFWSQWLELHGFLYCELAGHERGCSPGFEVHHIVSKQMLKGNAKALRYAERKWFIFLSCLCPAHHALANNWPARYKLLDKRVLTFGEAVVAKAVEELLILMKGDIPELHKYLECNSTNSQEN